MNNLSAERDGDLLRLYINGTEIYATRDPSPLVGGYFGVLTLASQFENTIAEFDNYAVTAWDSDPVVGAAATGPRVLSGDLPEPAESVPGGERLEIGD
ncbi:MAG: hypothetical protein R2873_24755 [Caldilineaceae bacterium]